MPFNGAGIYSEPAGSEAVTGATIIASVHNNPIDDIASALSQTLLRSGVAPMSGNLTMGGFKVLGLGAGSAAGDALRWEQFFQGAAWDAELTVASAATCNILGSLSYFVAISGTTTITSFGTGANKVRFVRATGAFLITHNATSLILPGAANITTAAGDTFIVKSDGSSNARVMSYQRAAVVPSNVSLAGNNAFTGTNTFSVAPRPSANDAAALGVSGTAWSDLFLASAAVINWGAGEATLAAASNTMTLAGAIFVAGEGGTLGDDSSKAVMIKGTVVDANVSALFNSTSVLTFANQILNGLGTEQDGAIIYHNGSAWVVLAPP